MSATLYALTLTSGYVYLKALTAMLRRKENLTDTQLKNSVESFLSENVSDIKNFIKEAKRNYKSEK